ncbi:hypothetical protein H5410_028387 [Solanum commersonii]|uniref:DUF8040 domain-containing protein n=1 Tax=Solanum commersonii TaxID=4109 RepID=A0A9J5Z4S9_SOLCO|nr:hypothetical protein H5410_028387 [Solanum commersonii]
MSARIPKILSHLNVLIHDNDIICIDKFRIGRNVFHILASLAKNIVGLIDGKNMLSTKKLSMFLKILAHQEKNRFVKVDYIISGWSISRTFNECLRVILKLTPVSTAAISNKSKKRARKLAPSSRWVWTPEKELTLVHGLNELCLMIGEEILKSLDIDI